MKKEYKMRHLTEIYMMVKQKLIAENVAGQVSEERHTLRMKFFLSKVRSIFLISEVCAFLNGSEENVYSKTVLVNY